MALSCVGYILSQLQKDSLIRICNERGLNPYGNKPILHHRLRSSFGSKPEELLTFLRKEELKLICADSEINISGNIDDLIKRIMSIKFCLPHVTSESNDFSEDEISSEDESDDFSEDEISSEDESDGSEGKSEFELELPERYTVVGAIGKGGFGEAFLCKDSKLKRNVVIKRPHPEHAERILREAKIQAQFQHQNIVSIYDINTDKKAFPFIVMEYCPQGSLLDRIKAEGNLRDYEIKSLVRGVTIGLKFIHQKNITHKDLGPHNIFFDSTGSAKIGDFGIAELKGSNKGGFHRIYRAPNIQQYDNTAYDLYTLGQTIITCWKGIPTEPYSQDDIPDKSTVDLLLWFIVWLLLSQNPEKRPETNGIISVLS